MELEVAILYFEHYQKWRQSRLLPLTRDNTPAHYCYTYTNTKYIEYYCYTYTNTKYIEYYCNTYTNKKCNNAIKFAIYVGRKYFVA